MSENYGYIYGCPCEYCKKEQAREVADKAAAEQAAAENEIAHPTRRLLTREMVVKGSPCYEYRTRFFERFPQGVEVTVELALSQINDWEWDWAGTYLLSRDAKAKFSRASRAVSNTYDNDMRPFWDIENNLSDQVWSAYDKALNDALAEGKNYNDAAVIANAVRKDLLSVPMAGIKAAREAANDKLTKARVKAWAEAFIADGPAYEEEHKNDGPFIDPYTDEGEEREDSYDEDDDYSDEEETW